MNETLATALGEARSIAFLCSGNMIRSAFAELWALHLECPLPVRSGATAYENDRIYPRTAEALRVRGVDPSAIGAFRPTTLERLLPQLDEHTLFFGMKREHLHALPADPSITARSFLLTAALGRADEIADPMFEGGFDEAIGTVAECVSAVVEELSR